MEKNEFGLPPVYYNALVAGAEAFFQTTGKALAAAINGTAGTRPGPMDPSYPPAYTAAAAMENIKAGYHYTGIRDGRRLSDEQLKEKEEGVAEAIAYFTAFGIPADMAEYGYRDGLTGFVGPRTFGSPGADLAEFVGKSLQTWLDQQWAIRAGGGKPSTGG